MLLSIIIPVSPADGLSIELLSSLMAMPIAHEIIVAGSHVQEHKTLQNNPSINVVSSNVGRAQALNAGAQAATGNWLWFLHADSQLSPDVIPTLIRAMTHNDKDQLLYFGLRFYSDNSVLQRNMQFNSLGVRLRSQLLLSPFGDQAFCINRHAFNRSGGYDESLRYGEDHCLVWACRMADIAVIALPAAIITSARKYQQHGWIRTTLRHNFLWFKQWLPLFSLLVATRLKQQLRFWQSP